MGKLLTIAIATLPQRASKLESLLSSLKAQQAEEVEVIWLGDFKGQNTVGAKRNKLAAIAEGKYITFVDDDDVLAEYYVAKLLEAIKANDVDVINFIVHISINGATTKPVFYSKEYLKDHNLTDKYLRIPNHLMCFKTELVRATPYDDINFCEDAVWAKAVLPKIKTEYNIEQVLYWYMANHATSETLPLHIKAALMANG